MTVKTRRGLGLRKTEPWQKGGLQENPFAHTTNLNFLTVINHLQLSHDQQINWGGISSRASSKQAVVPSQPIPVSNAGKWVTGEKIAQSSIQVNLEEFNYPLKDKSIFYNSFSVSAVSKEMCNKISDNIREG